MIHLREDRPLWVQAVEILADRIADGTYRPGQKMPSESYVMGEFGISRSTARKVIAHLRDELGLIYTVPQIGSFVRKET